MFFVSPRLTLLLTEGTFRGRVLKGGAQSPTEAVSENLRVVEATL